MNRVLQASLSISIFDPELDTRGFTTFRLWRRWRRLEWCCETSYADGHGSAAMEELSENDGSASSTTTNPFYTPTKIEDRERNYKDLGMGFIGGSRFEVFLFS